MKLLQPCQQQMQLPSPLLRLQSIRLQSMLWAQALPTWLSRLLRIFRTTLRIT